jgi:hypothetical protein
MDILLRSTHIQDFKTHDDTCCHPFSNPSVFAKEIASIMAVSNLEHKL